MTANGEDDRAGDVITGNTANGYHMDCVWGNSNRKNKWMLAYVSIMGSPPHTHTRKQSFD